MGAGDYTPSSQGQRFKAVSRKELERMARERIENEKKMREALAREEEERRNTTISIEGIIAEHGGDVV